MKLGLRVVLLFAFALAVAGCSSDDSDPNRPPERSEEQVFIDEHWSDELLLAAYDPDSSDSERTGEGAVYFPMIEGLSSLDDLDLIPLWVSREENEAEFMRNAAIWDQFIFGWKDYRRASVARAEYDYQPSYVRSDLSQPWVSPNRDRFREILGVDLPK